MQRFSESIEGWLQWPEEPVEAHGKTGENVDILTLIITLDPPYQQWEQAPA